MITLYGILSAQGIVRGADKFDEICSSENTNEHKILIQSSGKVIKGVAQSPGLLDGEQLCRIRIRGTCDKCLIIFHQINETGLCLSNRTLTYKQDNKSCPEQSEYFRGKIDLSLQVAERVRPAFYIPYSVYPVFTMEDMNNNSSLDASKYPNGYITNESTLKDQTTSNNATSHMAVKINNLLETSTVTMEINQINPKLSHNLGFQVRSLQRLFILPKHSVGVHHLTYYGINLQHERGMSDAVGGVFIRIKYSVQSCDTNIRHLEKLDRELISDSYKYLATCHKGFKLRTKVKYYSCKDQQWDPILICDPDPKYQRPHIPSELERNTVTTDVKSDRDHKLQTTEQFSGQVHTHIGSSDTTMTPSAIISIIGSTVGLLTVFALSLILYCSIVRGKIGAMTVAHNKPTQPRVQDCNCEAELPQENVKSVSGYEVIDSTDPYMDYAEIDERDMIRNLDQIALNHGPRETAARISPTTGDTSSSYLISTDNLKFTSLDLFGSISREASKRGINLQKARGSCISRLQSRRKSKRQVPYPPLMPCKGHRGYYHRQQLADPVKQCNGNAAMDHNEIIPPISQPQVVQKSGCHSDIIRSVYISRISSTDYDDHNDLRSNLTNNITLPCGSCSQEDALSIYMVDTLDVQDECM